ncbi:hypothetical protein HV337_00395 [Citrobacter freundii]|uniref:hypothetical protein n=1 Tax=Citrobacter freundii TaxID=546 RepID=UPI0015E9841B|nr:hypothetical protein [Citrobacter freundii]QLR71090.1 hypothetical protein HV337_00395 [Citrobacter freundii]
MNDIYDLVRRTDAATVASFPTGGRWQLYTDNGIASVRSLSEEEVLITPAGMVQFLRHCGYTITPPEETK